MYEELFHAAERPFRATPDPKFYYPHDSIETARQTAVRAVLRAEGPVMVLAGAGLGKSLLGMVIAADLGAKFDVVKLHAARLCSRRALLQNILFELQMPYRDLSEGELRFSILDRLEPSKDNAPDGLLIIVDEAHTLPAKLLDELRVITNFTRGNQPRARMVLIGNLRLEHTLAEPQLESFNQRLAARCYLQPMNRQQTNAYVKHQLTVAGVNPKRIVTEDAINTVYAASEGVPRLANQVMDHALVLAITRAQCPISSALVEEAWSDLQQLPAPWHSGTDKYAGAFGGADSASVSAVEFGSLDDDMGEELDGADDLATRSNSADLGDHCQAELECEADRQCEADQESEEELRFADDLEQSAPPRRTNFFTAFAPVDDDTADQFSDESTQEFPDRFAEALRTTARESELVTRELVTQELAEQELAEQELAEQFDLLVRPHVDLDETRDAAHTPSDSFFTDRPTDEQLLAFDLEQEQFDTMGVWENDPPLAAIAPSTRRDVAVSENRRETSPESRSSKGPVAQNSSQPKGSQPISSQRQTVQADWANNPFGDDFDEEITVNSSFAAVVQPTPASQESKLAHTACEHKEPGSACRAAACPCSEVANDKAESWTVDVASLDLQNEVAVQHEIEDLVSQLNFAAFAIEPFSVEQISLEPQDLRPAVPADSIRNGQNEEIYAMHRPEPLVEQNVFNGWSGGEENAQFDDDRDLLLVEEDLPVAVKAAGEDRPPVTKMAPYSQLFANLRK